MGMSYTSPALSSDFMSGISNYFGFEVKHPTGDIDIVNEWTKTIVGTGTATIGSNARMQIETGVVAAGDCSMVLNQPLTVVHNRFSTGESPFKKFILEFNMTNLVVGTMDEADFIVGGYGGNAPAHVGRADNSVCGIVLDGGVFKLQKRTVGGVETLVTTGIAEDTAGRLWRLEFTNGYLTAFADSVQVAQMPLVAGDNMMNYVNIDVHNAGAANAGVLIWRLRGWFELI